MIPTVGVLGVEVGTHDLFSVVALLVGLALYYLALRRERLLGRTILWISLAVVLGGVAGARIATAWEHLDYYRSLGDVPIGWAIEHSGKSLVGAIAGGWLAGVFAKRVARYRVSTGDCYALALPVAVAIGRIGCFLSELPLGTPTDLPWGVRVAPEAAAAFVRCPGCDLPMHPSMLYEVGFNLIAAALIVRFGDRVPVRGDLLKAYLLAAFVFRFAVEVVRANPPQALGLSGPQWVLIPLIALLVIHFARRLRSGIYRVPPAPRRALVIAREVTP